MNAPLIVIKDNLTLKNIGRLYTLYSRKSMEKSNYDRAIADYTQALKLDPNNAGAQKGIERLQDR